MLRGAHDPLPLLPPDAGRRATILALRARTNFDEDQRAVALAHDQIDLAAAARHVACDKTQALALQELLRADLESRADEFGLRLPRKVVGQRGARPGTRRRLRASCVLNRHSARSASPCVAQ